MLPLDHPSQETPSLLSSTFKSMALLIAHPEVPLAGVNAKVLNCMEGMMEVRMHYQVLGGGLC